MKAVIYRSYGPPKVLQVVQMEKPQPKDHELLVRIHAATVTSGDVRLRASDFPPLFWLPARLIFGLFQPRKKILGHEFSGVVEEVGKHITSFKPGDAVFGTTTMLPTGSYAEHLCLPETWKHGVMAIKPNNVTFEEAAALPIGGMTALYLLNKANIAKGQEVLIYGASGSVGSYAVQIAKIKGAHVTAVCSGANFDMVKDLGADRLIDYTQEDFTKGNHKFDIIFDAVGKSRKSKKVIKKGGSFVTIKMMTKEKSEDLGQIKSWSAEKRIIPFIDRYYDLDTIVAAHTYVESGRKRGNLVLKIHS